MTGDSKTPYKFLSTFFQDKEKDAIADMNEMDQFIRTHLFYSTESENSICPNPEPVYHAA